MTDTLLIYNSSVRVPSCFWKHSRYYFLLKTVFLFSFLIFFSLYQIYFDNFRVNLREKRSGYVRQTIIIKWSLGLTATLFNWNSIICVLSYYWKQTMAYILILNFVTCDVFLLFTRNFFSKMCFDKPCNVLRYKLSIWAFPTFEAYFMRLFCWLLTPIND